MNWFNNNTERFNELVFEHRNKEYGAYLIRNSYNDTIIKSFGVTVAGLCVSVALLVWITYKPATELMTYTGEANIAEVFPNTRIIEYKVNPPKTQAIKTEQPKAAANNKMNVQVSDEKIDDKSKSVINDKITNGQSDQKSDGTSTTSTNTTTTTSTMSVVSASTVAINTAPIAIAEEMPEFEGGIKALHKFIAKNLQFPKEARYMEQKGTVYVSFIVDELGNVTNAKVLKGIGYGCDEEALRVISKLPKWKKGGKNAGQPVKVMFNIPISFKLADG